MLKKSKKNFYPLKYPFHPSSFLFLVMFGLFSCQDDCEPSPKNQISFRFLQKNTLRADTVNISQIKYTDANLVDETQRINFSGFILLDINPNADFTSYTFTGIRKNIPFSRTLKIQYNKTIAKNGSGKCGSIIKVENLATQNTDFEQVIVRVSSLENDKKNQYDVGLIIND